MNQVAVMGRGDVVQTPAPSPESGTAALMKIIERGAADPSFDVAKLEKLLEVKERWEANEARKAFVAAKAAFKAEAPAIGKNKHVGFESRRGGADTNYYHATLDHVAEVLSPVLSKHGLAYSWDTQQNESGYVTVTCVLTHVMGHSERVTLRAGIDQSGNKNGIQAVGSTVTYLSRYTLLAVTGMATGDQDDDGRASETPDLITEEQKDQIIGLIKETNSNVPKFLEYMGVSAVDEIPANKFPHAKAALEKKRNSGGAK